jgi:hypothetical protein
VNVLENIPEIIPADERCKVCNKRKSTRLCDAITGEYRYAGHPPKINGEFSDEPMSGVITCDMPMCEKCATQVTPYMDLCPEHSKPLIKAKVR